MEQQLLFLDKNKNNIGQEKGTRSITNLVPVHESNVSVAQQRPQLQNDAELELSFYKTQLRRRVGSISLFNNCSLFLILAFYLFQWSSALNYAMDENNHPNKNQYEYRGMTFTKAIWFVALNSMGSLLAFLAIWMDISLRDKNIPVN